jgi:hypothetical protein
MKQMNPIPFVLMALALSLSVHADVYKCKDPTGKIIYQPVACSLGASVQGVIKVKEMTPEETNAAKAKLKAWQEQQAVEDASKREAEKQRQTELEKQESLELQRRSVVAQEQQAIAEQQRQQQNNNPIVVAPYGFDGRYWNNQSYVPYDGWQPNKPPHYPHPHNQWEQPMSQPQPSPSYPYGVLPSHPNEPRPGMLKNRQQ